MIDFYKKANFYFILILIAATVWAVITPVFLKAANEEWDKTELISKDSERLIAEIIILEPDRLKLHNEKKKMGKFDFNTVIDKFAQRHKIPDSAYGLRVTDEKKQRGVVTQGATMTISNIKVVKFSRFLSEMLYLWPNLQCDSLSMSNQSTGPDAWKAVMQFKYTFKNKK
jgi:hypothetical protein